MPCDVPLVTLFAHGPLTLRAGFRRSLFAPIDAAEAVAVPDAATEGHYLSLPPCLRAFRSRRCLMAFLSDVPLLLTL